MSLDAFRKALDDLPELTFCEGSHRLDERLAIALPDGDVAAADDKTFVDWLVEHSEPAPFGAGGKTKVDKKVRDAMRLVARGKAAIAGFDPAAILGEIETVLSPREHLDAKLSDVLLYRAGGHFARHKDTPRDPGLVGTLIVGLPIAHEGGAFTITDSDVHTIDWSGKPEGGVVRWVAMFADADHEIDPVSKGARVTLVYSLSLSGRPREDAASAERMTVLGRLAGSLALPQSPLMIACSRHVITEDSSQLQGIDVLRGRDREIADTLVENGFHVAVRSCITAVDANESGGGDDDEDGEQTARLTPDSIYTISRLDKPITKKDLSKIDSYCCTFAQTASYDGEEMPAGSFAPFILDSIQREQWVIRKSAAGKLIHEAEMFSEDGYFGNEGYEAHIYTLAALEVKKGQKMPKVPAPSAPKRATAPKPQPPSKKATTKKAAAKTKTASKKR